MSLLQALTRFVGKEALVQSIKLTDIGRLKLLAEGRSVGREITGKNGGHIILAIQ